MSTIPPVSSAHTSPATPPDKIRQTASRLEGVFVEQMFKAMRDTVPHEDGEDVGGGEEMFTSLFDQAIADDTPSQWQHGLARDIARVLREHSGSSSAPAAPTAPAAVLIDASAIPPFLPSEPR